MNYKIGDGKSGNFYLYPGRDSNPWLIIDGSEIIKD